MREPRPELVLPSTNSLMWRDEIQRGENAVDLNDILTSLWDKGIPVIPIEILPSPNFQGLACIIEDRPVILLGHKHDEPGRVAHFIAHETGHIVAGDCSPGQPIIDEAEEILDEDSDEQAADQYATHVLVGDISIPEIDARNPHELALEADRIERSMGIDSSAAIFAWARRTGKYKQATVAAQALYKHKGARRLLREQFDTHVDLESASESDRSLLRCVFGNPS